MFKFGYNPLADYDLDGTVDSFEEGLFLMEMEKEDEMIASKSRFFDTDDEDDDDDFDLFEDDDDDDF